MDKNYVVSFTPIQASPVHTILWGLRQFGITNRDIYGESKATLIQFQGYDFQIFYDTNLPFNGFYISLEGPKLSSTSYIRKGLIELIDLMVREEFGLQKFETSVLNSDEFELLRKNYARDVISKFIFYTKIYSGTINLELIEHTRLEAVNWIYLHKYALDFSKVKDQVYALHCISQQGEIEFHNAVFLKLDLQDYIRDCNLLAEKTNSKEIEMFLTKEISIDSKILRIRYDYDIIAALYFIVNPDKYILFQCHERFDY